MDEKEPPVDALAFRDRLKGLTPLPLFAFVSIVLFCYIEEKYIYILSRLSLSLCATEKRGQLREEGWGRVPGGCAKQTLHRRRRRWSVGGGLQRECTRECTRPPPPFPPLLSWRSITSSLLLLPHSLLNRLFDVTVKTGDDSKTMPKVHIFKYCFSKRKCRIHFFSSSFSYTFLSRCT